LSILAASILWVSGFRAFGVLWGCLGWVLSGFGLFGSLFFCSFLLGVHVVYLHVYVGASSSPAIPRAFPVWSSSSGGGSSSLKVDPSRVTASKPFGASLAVSQLTASPSTGATELGEKLRSSPPVVSKPFQRYIRKVRVLREGVSWKWNDVLVSNSLKASKMVAEPPAKKVAEPLVKDFLRKGFLNPRPDLPTTSSSPRKVFDGGIVGPSSPPRGCSSSSSELADRF
jgi:hypothetical protein